MQQTFGQNNCWYRDQIDFCTFMVARATYNKCAVYASSSVSELTRFHHEFYFVLQLKIYLYSKGWFVHISHSC